MTNRQIKLSPKNKISESSLPLPKEKLLLTYPSSILVNDDLLFLSSLKSNKKDKVNKWKIKRQPFLIKGQGSAIYKNCTEFYRIVFTEILQQ